MENLITEEQIKKIINKIVEGYNPQKIILFGSYVSGEPTQDSDVDLLIIKDTGDSPRERRKKISRILWRCGVPKDVFVYSAKEFAEYKDIAGTIMYAADKFGRVIYG